MKISETSLRPNKKKGYGLPVQTVGPSLKDILADVCRAFNMNPDEIKARCREGEIMKCKRIYCYVSCVLTDASFASIGSEVNITHPSVMNNITRVEDWKNINDPVFMEDWEVYKTKSKIWQQ